MDASVEFLLDNLKQLVVYNANLMSEAKQEFEQLNDELKMLKAVQKDASQKYKKDEIYKLWEREIREVIYEIEDTIDKYITHMTADAARKKNTFKRLMHRPPKLAKMIKTIRRNKVKPQLYDSSFELFTVAETSVAQVRDTRLKKTQNIVGFEEEAKEFIEFINGESNKLEIASVVGMAGLGKTTLAWKIYKDLKYEFHVRIWVNVSDTLNMKKVLHTILSKFTATIPDETVEELVVRVRNHLKTEKFFIVVDDIWTIEAWGKVKEILPKNNHMGRVLVTTRHKDVAEYSSTRTPHCLRFRTTAESWQLLQNKVFGNLNVVPKELEGVRHAIAKDCNGLPLSIVVIGGILVEKKSRMGNNISAIKKEWVKVSKNVKSYLVDGDKKKLLLSSISLSYEKIPNELRNCFLYLGVFPEDADISVKELVRLWIAEGFIVERPGMSLEEVALDNLEELINRNLVMVKEMKHNGEPKICHIHNSVHEFCSTESKYENLNLFQEITRSQRGFSQGDHIEKFRRLCIHSYALDFLKKTKKVSNARSFLCFEQSSIILETADMACVTDIFGLLRVYDAKTIKFSNFPQTFLQLVHLRYLTLVVEHCTSLPEAIFELWNLQTLIVDVSSRTFEIKADIGKTRQLRHLNTKSSIILKKDGRGEGGKNLQTLSRLCPESCTDMVFRKVKNLITLGIQGELNKIVSFEPLWHLDHLQKLKLVNDVPDGAVADYPLKRLPDFNRFPPNLKVLVLSATYMHWRKISMLSMLGSLEVLKLKNNAFVGNSWEVVSTFDQLIELHIEKSSELVYWKASDQFFPELRVLVLNNCEKLVEIPSAVSQKLEKLCMQCVPKELLSSAEAIAKEKQKQRVAFKLDITSDNEIQKA